MPLSYQAPIVDITIFGIGISVDQYAENALQWAKRELVPLGSIFCPCLNGPIYFSNKKVRHTIMQKKVDQQGNFNIDTISVLSEMVNLIENATLRYATSDAKGRENVVRIYKLLAVVELNGINRNVEILIQEIYHEQDNQTKLHFYNHILL